MANWDARLLTAAHALELVSGWPVTASYEFAELSQFENVDAPPLPDQWQINLRCHVPRGWRPGQPETIPPPGGECGQSVAMVATAGQHFTLTIDGDLIPAVLRHAVMAHNVSLSGAPVPQAAAAPGWRPA